MWVILGKVFKTISVFSFIYTMVIANCVLSISYRKEQETVILNSPQTANNDKCDQTRIPVMNTFDFNKFTGDWYEVSKTVAGYIDVDDGMWKITASEPNTGSNIFLFSGRDNNQHCIRAIRGKVTPSTEPHGKLELVYQTYSTRVKETVRVLFTDYDTMAVIYTCLHVNIHTGFCHEAGIYGAIWSRAQHVDAELYGKALKYLELACVQKDTLRVRNLVGPCNVDDVGYRDDDFPAPDFCYQPLNLGSCQGNVQRYFYDPQEKACKNFTYGGCQGNENNFLSMKECHMQCVSVSSKEPVCMSTAKCGIHCPPCCREDKVGCVDCDCESIIVDHQFFNCVVSPSLCSPECEAEEKYPNCYVCDCGDMLLSNEKLAICEEVKDVGKCTDKLERFYYDAIAEKCVKFIYTGCKGNNNNFNTLQECNEKCHFSEQTNIQFSMTMSTDSATISSNSVGSLFLVMLMSLILLN